MPSIFPAQPYYWAKMGSFGDASHMLLRQYRFPVSDYEPDDVNMMWDDDRCLQADREHARACFNRHTGTNEGGFGFWLKKASDEQVMEFIKDMLKASANIIWTGYRITLTVHRGNGWDIHTLELFAKHPKSDVRLTTSNPHGLGTSRPAIPRS